MMNDWSNLPRDLVGLIFERLQFLCDIQQFAFVCHSWRSVAMETCHPFHPLLIMCYDEDAETCNFYGPVDKKVFRLHLPELHMDWCCGASNGWLVMADDDLVVRLLHPFSRTQISLSPFSPLSPRSTRFRQEIFEIYQETGSWKSVFVSKLILSCSPLNPECVFISIGGRGQRISFCRATDETWTAFNFDYPNLCSDAIFYKGRIYAARRSCLAAVLDIGSKSWVDDKMDEPEFRRFRDCERFGYFVKSSGDLLYVLRHMNYYRTGGESIVEEYVKPEEEVAYDSEEDVPNTDGEEEGDMTHKTIEFEVFKLTDEEEQWKRVTCLGDRALFLGRNQSFSLSVTRYPEYKANHIYFTDDSMDASRHHDMGEFNLENGSITFYDDLEPHIKLWQPIWFKQD